MTDLYNDVMTVEQGAESAEEYYAAIQGMINSGTWSLQGTFGRTMMDAIESGKCMLGQAAAHDYWGNRIPARGEVMEGTKGSREFVAKQSGEDWAKLMEEVQ